MDGQLQSIIKPYTAEQISEEVVREKRCGRSVLCEPLSMTFQVFLQLSCDKNSCIRTCAHCTHISHHIFYHPPSSAAQKAITNVIQFQKTPSLALKQSETKLSAVGIEEKYLVDSYHVFVNIFFVIDANKKKLQLTRRHYHTSWLAESTRISLCRNPTIVQPTVKQRAGRRGTKS